MGAIGGAISVVSGIVGMSQQNKAAAAQKKAIASQQEQAALQAQLQYMSLKQQTYADSLNDYITDKTRELQYAQSQTALLSQQMQNDLAVSNAVFDASVQKASANLQQSAADIQAQRQESQANLQAGQQTTETQGQAYGQEQELINSFLKSLGEDSSRANTIANILDQMAAGGGVNEALSLLLDSNGSADVAAANSQRQQQQTEQKIAEARQVEQASRGLNQADRTVNESMNALANTQQVYQADRSTQNALGSQQIANAGFSATRAANDANYKIGVISDSANRTSRDYLRQANESALTRGAQLQSDILKAQADQVRSPGFFDYLNVGMQGYQTYRQLS